MQKHIKYSLLAISAMAVLGISVQMWGVRVKAPAPFVARGFIFNNTSYNLSLTIFDTDGNELTELTLARGDQRPVSNFNLISKIKVTHEGGTSEEFTTCTHDARSICLDSTSRTQLRTIEFVEHGGRLHLQCK